MPWARVPAVLRDPREDACRGASHRASIRPSRRVIATDQVNVSDSIEIRPYRPGDETALVAGYNKVFPTEDGKIKPRSMEHWHWKFRDNPTGLIHVAVAEHEQEGIVGCYVTLPVKIRTEGTYGICGQVVDLFVLPEFRRHTGRPGLFVHTALKQYEWFGGNEEGQNLFHYGWPVPNWRIGHKYLNYENVCNWDFLFRECAGTPREATEDLEVIQVERFGEEVDALWAAMEPSFELALVRDARYLNWRYADAHDHDYRLYECRERSTGKVRGLFVYSVCDFLFPRTGFVVDWLLPHDDADATVAMLAVAERQASADGAKILATLFGHMDPRFLQFQRLGYMLYGTSYFVVVAPFKYSTHYYREHWYITAGDSDLV